MTLPTHWFRADNPLIRHLPNLSTLQEINQALHWDPLAGIDVAGLTLPERHELLTAEKLCLLPTNKSLAMSMTLMSMHRSSLRHRNPLDAAARRLTAEMIEAGRAGADFLQLPPAPGACLFTVMGVTGTAKTVTAKHACRLLGPQVIEHGEEPNALWKGATQLSWLYVGMSHDGSRGGLLVGILLQIDLQLGTNCAKSLPKQYRTIDKLAGATIALLHTLYVGILIIDEIQLLNLVMSEHSDLMHLFLLNLANSGIAVVLVGNPLGFTWLSTMSQNLSRSIERPGAYFHPCGSIDEEDEWAMVFEGITRYYVLPLVPAGLASFSDPLKRRSGGIPRVALAIWCQAQLDALFCGRDEVVLGDIDNVYASSQYGAIGPLIDGFANRDPILLMPWIDKDVPVAFYAQAWRKEMPDDNPAKSATIPAPRRAPTHPSGTADQPSPGAASPSSREPPLAPPPKPRKRASASSKLKAAKTREANKNAARAALAKSLPLGDMRMEGLTQFTMQSIDELMRSIEGSPEPSQPPERAEPPGPAEPPKPAGPAGPAA